MVVAEKTITQELARRELARRNLLDYTRFTMPEFDNTPFHEVYYEILNRFAHKQIKKLMVTIGPQHGKSEGSSRRLPSFVFGRSPNTKIAILSYAAEFAHGFNRDNQRIINSPEYQILFPDTKISNTPGVDLSDYHGSFQRTSTVFDILGTKGKLKAVGRKGQITGDPVDMAIMDDLYKDAMEGNSPQIRDSVIEWYTSVVMKRLHNDSQQLIVFTRWHAEDLIGWLEEKSEVILLDNWAQLDNPRDDVWYKINFPTIQNKEPTELDPREMGEPLYPKKHSLQKLEEEREIDPEKFESMNQGDPTPKAGLLYTQGFGEYHAKPTNFKKIANHTDVADTGSDYLCSINYGVGLDDYIYILDVYYTQEAQEVTEPGTAQFLKRSFVRISDMESNNGGRGFARNVDRELKGQIIINAYHQTLNKESKILTNAAECQRKILFPMNWKSKYPLFAKHLLQFKRKFRANKHDDSCFIAGTKVATTKGDVNIEDIKVGDMVITPSGIRKVTASGMTGHKPVITNMGLTGTHDHKVYYNHSFTDLDTLTDVLLLSRLSYREVTKWKYKKLLFLMELNTNLWERESIISASQVQIKDERVLKDCMLQFGNFIMEGKFLKGISFIIKTLILLTTTLTILSVYHLQNMLRHIPKQKREKQLTERTWLRLRRKQRNGIEVQKELNGTDNMLKKVSVKVLNMISNVRTVIKNINLFKNGQHSVVSNVGMNTDTEQMKRSSNTQESVSSVKESSEEDINKNNLNQNYPIPVVENVEPLSWSETEIKTKVNNLVPVYNITVDVDHVFYANGFLVSNCDSLTEVLLHSGISNFVNDGLYRM